MDGKAVANTRIAEMRRRVIRQCSSMGIDIERIPHDDGAVRVATKALKRLADRMGAREARSPTAPTPERMRQAGEPPIVDIVEPANGPIPALKRHRFDWPVDQAMELLTVAEYNAAARLRDAYYGMQPRSAISSYGGGVGGGDPASKLPLAERQEAAGRDFNALWDRLPAEIRVILKTFVLEEAAPGAERAPTPAEFGMSYGRCRDARRAKGVADGALKAALSMLAATAQEYDQWKAQKRREQQRRVA